MRRIGGWWRLWIAIAGIWAVLAIGVGTTIVATSESADARRESTMEWSCKDYTGRLAIDMKSAPVDVLLALKYSNQTSLNTVEAVDRCIKARQRDYAGEASKMRINTVVGTTLGAISLPLIILILGSLIGWVIRGFRASKTGQ